MNKHVAKLLQPGVFWYCLIMLAFAAAAALFDSIISRWASWS